MDIPAIPTRYQGYYFRARGEARWAVFFDALDYQWDYEIEGFKLGAAGWYLPDFYLRELDLYVEIKKYGHDSLIDKRKAEAFREGGGRLLVLYGIPGHDSYYADYQSFIGQLANSHADCKCLCFINASGAMARHRSAHCTSFICEMSKPQPLWDSFLPFFVARSARFEFGQTPEKLVDLSRSVTYSTRWSASHDYFNLLHLYELSDGSFRELAQVDIDGGVGEPHIVKWWCRKDFFNEHGYYWAEWPDLIRTT